VNLSRDKKLEAQNAQSGSIGADFGRLGLKFWDAVDEPMSIEVPAEEARVIAA
jgi:hypothetical protein